MQQFQRGDVVHIAKDLGSSMSHFDSDRDAVVLGSYRDQFGGGPDNEHTYTLLFLNGARVSWYYDSQLTLLRHGSEADIDEIQCYLAYQDMQDSNLNWIVANWATTRDHPSSASIHALAALAGYSADDLWGKHGESIDYYANTRQLLAAFDPVLLTGDVAAVRVFGATLRIDLQSHNLSQA